MKTTANDVRPIRSPASASATGTVTAFAWFGGFMLLFAGWVWSRWIFSDNFRPIDPGPDPLPVWQYWVLTGIQVGGFALALWVLWRTAIQPKLRDGSFTTNGLIVLALPTMWFQDFLFGYGGTWMTYNTHLWNMGSWAPYMPGWQGMHPENFPAPLVDCYGWLFWVWGMMLFTNWVMRKVQQRFPGIHIVALMAIGFVMLFLLDVYVEFSSIMIGWYAVPGAWRHLSLMPGTPTQVPLHECFLGAIQTMSFALLLFFRDDQGHTFAERGATRLNATGGRRTFIRYLAIVGAMHSLYIVTYTFPMLWASQHTDRWVDGMPSYFTRICPEYHIDPALCGGPGLPTHRPDYIWLPKDAGAAGGER